MRNRTIANDRERINAQHAAAVARENARRIETLSQRDQRTLALSERIGTGFTA